MENTKTNKTICKHGMIPETCAVCAGLVVPAGKLHTEWIALCDDTFDKAYTDDKSLTKQEWFKTHRTTVLNRFFKKWQTKPPYPTYPEK